MGHTCRILGVTLTSFKIHHSKADTSELAATLICYDGKTYFSPFPVPGATHVPASRYVLLLLPLVRCLLLSNRRVWTTYAQWRWLCGVRRQSSGCKFYLKVRVCCTFLCPRKLVYWRQLWRTAVHVIQNMKAMMTSKITMDMWYTKLRIFGFRAAWIKYQDMTWQHERHVWFNGLIWQEINLIEVLRI